LLRELLILTFYYRAEVKKRHYKDISTGKKFIDDEEERAAGEKKKHKRFLPGGGVDFSI